jgi:3-hydroxymyristoyl/3-hydroxydecanoyl-(acyl carrier protein) dehydratase
MTSTTISMNQTEIKTCIPHRFENLLLDSCVMESPGIGSAKCDILPDDALGRNIFLGALNNSEKELLTPITMEILALTAIVVTGRLANDETAFFAGISNFERHGNLKTNGHINTNAQKRSDKGGFLMFRGELHCDSGHVQGDLTAFFTKISALSDNPDKKQVEKPVQSLSKAVDAPTSKSNDLFILDKIIAFQDQRIATKYTYPKNHPFTKGHFPNMPIMMGVMQWMMVEDACYAIVKELEKTGKTSISGDAVICNSDGILVCEIKRFKVDVWLSDPTRSDGASTQSLKRIMFRSMVKPGDTLLLNMDYEVN